MRKVQFSDVYSDVYSLPDLLIVGQVRFDPYRKDHKYTGLLAKTGFYGGQEFFVRVGDFNSRQEAEDAVRKEEIRRQDAERAEADENP